jgi:hypothetical protein
MTRFPFRLCNDGETLLRTSIPCAPTSHPPSGKRISFIQVPIRIVHVEDLLILLNRLLILRLCPATGNQPYDHQPQW